MAKKQKRKIDPQMTGLAGEFFVAAELLKRGLQTSVSFGNAKAIDLFAVHPTSGRTFTVQVKAQAAKNYFLIDPKRVVDACIYVFVLLNAPGMCPTYFILGGQELLSNREQFGRPFNVHKMPGIAPKLLEPWKENWAIFEAP